MTEVTYDIFFKSGADDAVHYQEGDNIQLIQIENSDNNYYQNGTISLYDMVSSQSVGDEVQIYISDTLQFDGYVSRKEQTIDTGKKVENLQIIGKTYDLWRYHTGKDITFSSGVITGYIASSLVGTYATGISGAYDFTNSGTVLGDTLDLSYQTIGDALTSLVNLDGYKFYIDTSDNLYYYKPEKRLYDFTIEEDDIVDMSPIEEADEDIINDVLIVGGTGYSKYTKVSTSYPSSTVFPSGVIVAQQFRSEDNILSAIKLYLGRSQEPYRPDALNFEIWEDKSVDVFDDPFDDWSYISGQSNSNMKVMNGFLQLSGSQSIDNQSYYYPNSVTESYGNQSVNLNNCLSDYPTYAGLRGKSALDSRTDWEFTLTNPQYIDMMHIKYRRDNVAVKVDKVFVSGSWTDWLEIRNDDVSFPDGSYATVTSTFDIADCGYIYSGVKKIKIQWTGAPVGASPFYFRIYEVKVREYEKYNLSGNVKTHMFSSASNINYLRVEPSNVTYSSQIMYSGTCDSGANWTKLYANSSVGIANPGKRIALWYIMNPSGNFWATPSSLTLSPDTPLIGSCLLRASETLLGGGEPKSGSKIVWSDDITPTYSYVTYPPDWTEWMVYTYPKLALTQDKTYWMIMFNNSSNSEYWKYYYDPNSAYNYGKIMYSWDGASWSSNSDDPTHVKPGNLSFQMGWKETDHVVATATNQDSIDTYGRLFRKITDTTITTSGAAQDRADAEVSGMTDIPKKGDIVIDGRTDMETHYRFSSNFSNFDIDEIWDVVAYTQTIDNRGFTTSINYGRHRFDITKKISDLDKEVFG